MVKNIYYYHSKNLPSLRRFSDSDERRKLTDILQAINHHISKSAFTCLAANPKMKPCMCTCAAVHASTCPFKLSLSTIRILLRIYHLPNGFGSGYTMFRTRLDPARLLLLSKSELRNRFQFWSGRKALYMGPNQCFVFILFIYFYPQD